MTDSCSHRNSGADGVAGVQINFLPNPAPRRPVSPSHNQHSGRRVESVSGAGQPPIVVIRGDAELPTGLSVPAYANIMYIPPANLITEAVLIVRRWIQDIKRAPDAIMRV